jgi:Asp-tRNA(Asn)/Glu-tRNA(Gln) amidotransferase A subunit family amidase
MAIQSAAGQANVSDATSGADVAFLSAVELVELYRQRKLSPVEVTRAILDRIQRLEPKINAFALLDADSALASAERSEQRWHRGEPAGLIDGVPVALKDLILAKGWPTLRGSRAVDPNQEWNEDSPATARLREHGAVVLGKTTTSEFGWKGLGDSPLTGITRNPWNIAHTPGGSSGGSGAAAAIGFGPLHVATDGGGSTRLPAAHSGAFGFKQTFGRVPVYPPSQNGTLFHVTPLTRSVRDAALLLDVIARPDLRDWNALPPQEGSWQSGIEEGVKGLRIAYSPALGYATVDPEVAAIVEKAVKVFVDLGAIVEQRRSRHRGSAAHLPDFLAGRRRETGGQLRPGTAQSQRGRPTGRSRTGPCDRRRILRKGHRSARGAGSALQSLPSVMGSADHAVHGISCFSHRCIAGRSCRAAHSLALHLSIQSDAAASGIDSGRTDRGGSAGRPATDRCEI